MDLTELGDMGSGCEDENCSLASGFGENCSSPWCQWQEPDFGLIELVCVTVIYILLMLFGLLGNILTILVVWLRPHMRSSTYLYLSSMAVSDLLILLLLPLDLYKLWRPRPWQLGDFVCKLTMFLSECCTYCTILHITFLSLERYLVVCWPITAKTLVTRRRTRTLIGCLWLGAAVSAAPVLVVVGVEEVGGEELGLGGWREDGGWTSREGEFVIDRRQGGSGHGASMDGGLPGVNWMGWDDRGGEFEWFEEDGERSLGVEGGDERKQGGEGGSEEEGKMDVEGERQNKMKEDEGGGGGESVDEDQERVMDTRECRCTDYAVSSGLLSGMMILANLYFLVPLCILGLVYSLIGRTLWLRPKSSRKDQSHRHTVKMLGVVVLAFVLCWLPFHVGRTIFFLYRGSDRQEMYPYTHLDINNLSDASMDRNINTHPATEHISVSQSDDISTDKHLFSHVISHIRGQDMSAGTGTRNLDHRGETHTQTSCINTQNTTNHTPPATHTYAATAPDLHSENTHYGRPFNGTYTHHDTEYFWYYLSQYFNLVSSVFFFFSAAVNPLVYNLMSARFRHAVHSLIHTQSTTQSHRLRTLTARHSTTTL